MVGCEHMQVLHYEKNEEFRPHIDYSTDREQMRFMTFLMYLNDMPNDNAGGETTFPRVNLEVKPKKGHVVAFYSVTEDGNADPLTLHASTPIKEGIKWSAPIWIWDPNQS